MTPEIRQAAYRALFATHVEGELPTELRDITNKGLVLGSEKFQVAIIEQAGELSKSDSLICAPGE